MSASIVSQNDFYTASKRPRVFAVGYGHPDASYSKIVKVQARSSLEAGHIFLSDHRMPPGQVTHFLVDSADKPAYRQSVAAGSGRSDNQ